MTELPITIATLREARNNHWTKGEIIVLDAYIEALEKNDASVLEKFEAFGPTIRNRLMNMNSYLHALNFGFTHTTLDKNNWLDRHEFENEIIPFITKIDNGRNNIELGKGPNGKYTWSYHFNFGYAGSSSPLSVFCEPVSTRGKALELAVAYAKKEYSKYIGVKDDSGNYNQKLIHQVLDAIALKFNNVQLTIF